MDLIETLNSYNKNTLNAIGKTLGVQGVIRDRGELVGEIARRMGEWQIVRASLETLSTPERALLNLVQAAGGRLGTGALRALALRAGIIENQGRPNSYNIQPQAGSRVFEHIAARLIAAGLLVTSGQRAYSNAMYGFELLEEAIIPPPVLALLPPVPRQTENLAAPSAPPQIRSADAAAFQRDMYLYWSYLRDNDTQLTARGLMSKPNLKKVNAALSQQEDLDALRDENDAGRLRFLRGVLSACGLISLQGGLLKPAPDSDEFFTRPLARRTRAAFRAYRDGGFWDELARIPSIAIEGRRASDAGGQRFVVQARKAVLKLLDEAPAEGWIDVARFTEKVSNTRYEFLLPRKSDPYGYRRNALLNPYESYGNSLGWSFRRRTSSRDYGASIIRDEAEGWPLVEGAFIEAMLREPLYWLGLLDLGLAADDTQPWGARLESVRATPLGAHELMDAPLPEDTAPFGGRLIVQPTFQVLAYPPVSEVQLALLDRIAERGRLEQVAEYRLTRESIYRARQQHGLTVEDVVADLERESGTALPQNVAYTIQEWGRAQERAVLRDEVALVQVSDAAALDRLMEQDVGARLRRVAPTVALAPADLAPAVEQALFAAGELPQRVARPPDLEAGGPWLASADDGLLTLRPGAPAIYLRRALRSFALEAPDGWRLSAASVRQAAAGGLPPEQLVERLRAWSVGALPPALERQVLAWGGFFGSAAIERPVLLRASDERALQALLGDPEVAPLLRPIVAPALLAEVLPEQLDLLMRLLAERGVEIAGDAMIEGDVWQAPAEAPPLAAAPPPAAPKRRGRPPKPKA
jgi:hypothetical protein